MNRNRSQARLLARVTTGILFASIFAVLLPAIPNVAAGPTPPNAVSNVGTTTNSFGVGSSYSGFTCGGNGLYWVFYNDGSNWAWKTSGNGGAWSSENIITTAVPSTSGVGLMSFFCLGNTVYYVGAKDSSTDSNFYINSGTLSSTGAIAWGAEKSVGTTFPNVAYPSMTEDNSGNLWVVVQTSSSPGTVTDVEVWQGSGGTWSQSQIIQESGSIFGQIVPLTSGVGLLVGSSLGPITVTTHGSAGWGVNVVTTNAGYDFARSSASAIGNTIELCTTDYSNVYYMPFVFGSTSPPAPVTLALNAISCSMTTDGSSSLVAYYASSSGSAIEESTSNNMGASWVASNVAANQSHVTSIGASFSISSNPADQAMAVWLSAAAPYQVEFSTISSLIYVTEMVTITPATSGAPTTSAAVSGCGVTSSSIPMNGAVQSLAAQSDCTLTFTVPAAGASSRFLFNGGSTSWSYTTGSSGTDVQSNTVYYQYLFSLSYSAAAGSGNPASPTLTSTALGKSYTPILTGAPTAYWLDSGASWFLTPTLALGSSFWTTSQTTSGTVSGPLTLALAYGNVVLTTTSTTTATSTLTTTSTVTTSIAATTITSTAVSTTTAITSVTFTQTATQLEGSVPTSDYLTCDQTYLNVNQNTNCHATISPADEGALEIGTDTWHSSGGTFAKMTCNNPNGQGQVQCQAQFTSTSAGVQSIAETYSGDPYHAGSTETFLVFVAASPTPPGPNQGVPGSALTSTVVWCDQYYLNLNGPGPGPAPAPPPPGQNTNCHATVSNADGTSPTGTLTWTVTAGAALNTNPPPPGCPNPPGPKGQLQCQVQFISNTEGAFTVTATYSGTGGYAASSGSFTVFVIPNNNPITAISAAVWGALRVLAAGVVSFGQPVALMAGCTVTVLGLKGRSRLDGSLGLQSKPWSLRNRLSINVFLGQANG